MPQWQPCVLDPDKENYLHRLSIEVPDPIDALGAELLHLLGDYLLCLRRIVSIVELEFSGNIDISGIVGKGGVNGEIPRNRHPPVDLFGDIVAVDEPVHRLPYPGDGEWIELTGPRKDGVFGCACRVEGQLSKYPEQFLVPHLGMRLDPLENLRNRDVVGKYVHLPGLHHGNCKIVIGYDSHYLVQPGPHAGLFHRLLCYRYERQTNN